MPGRKICVQCGAPVTSRSDIEFEPPRAGRFEKTFRCGWLFRLFRPPRDNSGLSNIKNRMVALSSQLYIPPKTFFEVLHDFCFPFSSLKLDGRQRLGYSLFGLWTGIIILSILCYGSPTSGFLIFLISCIHLMALLFLYYPKVITKEITIQQFRIVPFLILVFYIPLLFLIGYFIPARTILAVPPEEQLHQADVVIYNRFWTRNQLKSGMLVLYRRNEITYNSSGAGPEHYQYQLQAGIHTDRIIACPGQTITWKNGNLLVDGVEVTDIPKVQLPIFPNHSRTLAENEYYILPLLRPIRQKMLPVSQVNTALLLGVITRDNIQAVSLFARRGVFYYFQP